MDNDSNLDNKSSIHSSLRNFTLKSILNIQKAIEHNKLVVFVGAGVSKNSGIPLWRELVQELAQELGLKSVANYSDGSDFWGGDDYLKIPQYYFNEREEKEYLDKIKEVLNRDVSPNEIHDIIFDLNPAHIVTTNYDNLLEKEYNIKQTDRRYEKVANDKELSSASMPNYIIKMHGEFDNIVLKECDYDSYSNNFKLMETYIKGLFATHTILFIGFGGSDPNIRRLIQWVKDIVGDKHQPAYLIDINNYEDVTAEEFRIKHEYYKKQGIFTLYKKQIQDDIEKVFINNQCKNEINLKDQGLDLYKFLYFIKNYKFFNVDKYYHKLKQLEALKVINNKILEKVFNVKIIDRLFNHYSYPNESEQQKFELDTLRLKFVLAEPDNLDDNLDLLKFNTTVKENIMMGKPNATEDELMSAIKSAHLEETIKELPQGLNTMLGERGLTLSGGQRQRVAIARAMLRNAPIVILDEATSALDNESEAIVQKAMDNLMQNKTVFVIAHRLSTIKNANRIAVINEGELVELGTHEELMSIENGEYKHLYEMQFRTQEV